MYFIWVTVSNVLTTAPGFETYSTVRTNISPTHPSKGDRRKPMFILQSLRSLQFGEVARTLARRIMTSMDSETGII